MASFPSTIKSPDLDKVFEMPIKEKIRTPTDSPYVISRAAYTGYRKSFKIGWDWLSNDEYEDLVAFFDSIGGSGFYWTHPATAKVYTVIFSDDALPRARIVGLENDGSPIWGDVEGVGLETVGAV